MTWQGPPGPYGQQPPPGYQYPPPGWPPPPPPPKSKTWLWVALVGVVLLVAAGVTVVLMTTGEPDSPQQTAGAPTTEAPQFEPWTVEGNKGDTTAVIRALAAGSDLVIVTQKSVTAIERGTGKKKWVAKAPDVEGQAAVFCGASGAASSTGKLGLTVGLAKSTTSPVSGDCGIATVLDLQTGQFGWSSVLAYPQGTVTSPVGGMPVEIIADTMVVNWGFNIFGLHLDDGKRRWQGLLSSRPQGQTPNCSLRDLRPSGKDKFVALSSCTESDGAQTFLLDESDVNGQGTRTKKITEQDVGAKISSMGVISGEPVVLQVHQSGNEQLTLLLLDDAWNIKNKISDERTASQSDKGLATVGVGFNTLPVGAYTKDYRFVMDKNVMYAITAPNKNKPNQLVAVDLATGKNLWAADQPGLLFMQVLAVGEGKVVALESPVQTKLDYKQSVVTVDAATGKVEGKKTTEVKPKNKSDFGIPTVWIGFVYADEKAYGVEFQSGGGGSEHQWMAYTVG
ncbi:PQQ-binding-like beta-propeller repeat protein [Kibdelosporangium aridum]|uniref:outer membrane protein assembly factor BamB family protein n=1 Tax=Kibdelosporangium aridum TaxID=2030 RepID=UPI000F7705C8|nr:PQQ-binding-like beta-propeller repeat protein [Kibdelosporangium aridum]